MSELRRTWFVERSPCAELAKSAANKDDGGLTPMNVWPTFALLAGGIGLSVLLVAAEVAYYHFAFSKVKCLQQTVSVRLRSMTGR